MNKYTLELENDQLLNIIPLVKFLKDHEGKDISLSVNQESHCLEHCRVYELLDLFNFKSVVIYTQNSIEQHKKYIIVSRARFYWLRKAKLEADLTKNYVWDQTKVFGCFYGRPSAVRLGIAGYLTKNYLEKSLIKIKFDTTHEDLRKQFEMTKIFSWDVNSLNNIDLLLSTIQLSTDYAYNLQSGEYDYTHTLSNDYRSIFVDIISEPNNIGNSFYPSEKFARAVLCKKPFIVMAPKHYLKYLKQMGFKTFNNWWSESYDDLEVKDRYFAILQLIDQIALLTINQLEELNSEMSSVTEHNYQLLISGNYSEIIKPINE